MTEQIVFDAEFASNPEPRCPCLLLLDVSGSMKGRPIEELNTGLHLFQNQLKEDPLAMKRVEVSIVTFGPVKRATPFQDAASFYPPQLTAEGKTPLGAAIKYGLELLEERKGEYKTNGISYYRPWIFLITDGAPTDSWELTPALIQEGEASKKFAFFAIGVENANMEILAQISVREPMKLRELNFCQLFSWLSNSLRSVSHSSPGETVPLEAPSGWAQV